MSHSRLSEFVALLDVPAPFDIDELVRRIGAVRGRPIVLRAVDLPADGPSGMWIATGSADHICYAAGTSPLHQEHIVLHELGHLLCGHTAPQPDPDKIFKFLMPSLDPAMVRSVLGRSAYSDPEERQAEMFAMLVLERANRLPSRRHRLSPELAEVLDRIEAALGAGR
ncbi:hypothetical protein LWC34_35990 [Kibdelosporangium philippinense]|uniref:IrrE N-terminal-like domain-containing protein n=1 Tax=Kibdelosporangium philippinense TaxID=211113 RepID=A0ABS8ZK74_9PSEU|nr:hypothetical protein [Kibdelosporangium philippinense]MCE7008181.1 hypothetical protein [Kibdelosporangium philippinense]